MAPLGNTDVWLESGDETIMEELAAMDEYLANDAGALETFQQYRERLREQFIKDRPDSPTYEECIAAFPHMAAWVDWVWEFVNSRMEAMHAERDSRAVYRVMRYTILGQEILKFVRKISRLVVIIFKFQAPTLDPVYASYLQEKHLFDQTMADTFGTTSDSGGPGVIP